MHSHEHLLVSSGFGVCRVLCAFLGVSKRPMWLCRGVSTRFPKMADVGILGNVRVGFCEGLKILCIV